MNNNNTFFFIFRNGNVPLKGIEKYKNLFKYEAYVSEAKRVLFANQSIILFVSYLSCGTIFPYLILCVT